MLTLYLCDLGAQLDLRILSGPRVLLVRVLECVAIANVVVVEGGTPLIACGGERGLSGVVGGLKCLLAPSSSGKEVVVARLPSLCALGGRTRCGTKLRIESSPALVLSSVYIVEAA